LGKAAIEPSRKVSMSAVKAAFFIKNVPLRERAVRGGASILLVVGGWSLGTPHRELAIASAATLLLTAVVGFCPMCAMVGRKLPTPDAGR
jgi:hypothetical protein